MISLTRRRTDRFVRCWRRFVTTRSYDAVVVGGGHNGLTAAAYLAKAGMRVGVFEKRHIVGGAAVTEELVEGFHFSRASYLGGLLRPAVIEELDLQRKYGLRFIPRPHSSFTPRGDGRSLLFGNAAVTAEQIAQFSTKDAEAFPLYEAQLRRFANVLEGVLDTVPPDPASPSNGSNLIVSKGRRDEILETLQTAFRTSKHVLQLGSEVGAFLELLTAPAKTILDRWFESETLKATLATDAVIGAFISAETPGSGYVLLHHVMGGDGWFYVRGGMGSISKSLAAAATDAGVDIETNAEVEEIVVGSDGQVEGLRLASGDVVRSSVVLSNATPHVTLQHLLSDNSRDAFIPETLKTRLRTSDYSSATAKINVAVDRLPQFSCCPRREGNESGAEHQGTIHINCESIDMLSAAFKETCQRGTTSSRPLVEMSIPSSLDDTISPPGQHVVNLFVQYVPFSPSDGPWTPETRRALAHHVFSEIDRYAPGFSDSVVGEPDVLAPPDLERVFSLTGGNIMHGDMSLDRLYINRPATSAGSYTIPGIGGLYLCGAGAHPGGGVMGAAGRNAARVVVRRQ